MKQSFESIFAKSILTVFFTIFLIKKLIIYDNKFIEF